MRVIAIVLTLLTALGSFAKEQAGVTVMVWPNEQQPVLRFTFGKFDGVTTGNQNFYHAEVKVENLWGKRIQAARFSVHFANKEKVRIGESAILLDNLGPQETTKFTMSVNTLGPIASLKLIATDVPPQLQQFAVAKEISMTVYSVPSGAAITLDGLDAGTTPKQIHIAVGHHTLEFTKEGYSKGTYPFEVHPDDVSGGNVTFELGGAHHDTVELRDGTTLNGDVESLNATEVIVRVGGTPQKVDRNMVKKILLVEREKPNPSLPNAAH